MFDEPEFDERTDGVVYATAAALGYATSLNLQFILANGGARLGTGEIFVAEVALAFAAFGGLLGYFLGRAKLEQDPIWWLPLGLVLTSFLGGLFVILRGQLDPGSITITGHGSGLPSFNGLILAGILAVVVTVIVTVVGVTPSAVSIVAGLKAQADCGGSPVQVKVITPSVGSGEATSKTSVPELPAATVMVLLWGVMTIGGPRVTVEVPVSLPVLVSPPPETVTVLVKVFWMLIGMFTVRVITG